MTDPEMSNDEPRLDQLLEEASLWFARMRGPDADLNRPAFDKWLARGAAHLGAYNRAAEIFSMGKFLAEPDEQPVEHPVRRGPRRGYYAALLASTAAALVFGFWITGARPPLSDAGPRPEIARLGPGQGARTQMLATKAERNSFRLADGSTALLEAHSALEVSFDGRERSLRLVQGRGRFDVAHEPRPFVVHAGGGSVTAHGTVFDVAIDARQRVTVKLLRGAIDVVLPTEARSVRRLAPGQELSFASEAAAALAPDGALAGQATPAPGSPTVSEFDAVKLSDLVAGANATGGPRLRLADPALGELRVSGRFRISDPASLADRLAALQNFQVERNDAGDITLRRRPGN